MAETYTFYLQRKGTKRVRKSTTYRTRKGYISALDRLADLKFDGQVYIYVSAPYNGWYRVVFDEPGTLWSSHSIGQEVEPWLLEKVHA